jgi:hypothetical protein
MIRRELLKAEIDKVKSEHLELLYGIIKLLENGSQAAEADTYLDGHRFVVSTYGCLADAPILRGEQGHHEMTYPPSAPRFFHEARALLLLRVDFGGNETRRSGCSCSCFRKSAAMACKS